MTVPPPRWTVPGWQRFAGLRHGFFGRAGGVSGGPFAALNCSSSVGDDPAAVEHNRALAARVLDCADVVTPRQVHGDRVATLAAEPPGEADALISLGDVRAVGVLTADCVPLLLVVPRRRVAAAVHAGWKGTALGIAARAAERLAQVAGVSTAEVHAALGPAIGECCYEVGAEVVDALTAGAAAGLVAPRRREAGKAWIDLRSINAAILRAAGVPAEQIVPVGPCTRCAGDACFSHRGAGGTTTGRQLSAVAWG